MSHLSFSMTDFNSFRKYMRDYVTLHCVMESDLNEKKTGLCEKWNFRSE